MSDNPTLTTPIKARMSPSNPESPTTARELDFDDEVQEQGITPVLGSRAKSPSRQLSNEGAPPPPPKPPRPLSPRQQAENTLKEAFPSIDAAVVKAVLIASSYNIERSFHALLGMSDPSAQETELPPAKPPRPSAERQRQLEADEMYARQLAEHYSGAEQYQRRSPVHYDRDLHYAGSQRDVGYRQNELYDDEREYNFFEDDLPIIKENLRKGFLETQTKVNSWFTDFKKRIGGEEEPPSNQQAYSDPADRERTYRIRHSVDSRRSGDRDRYDADPQVLPDDFDRLHLRDSEAPQLPPRPTRPLANPDLFRLNSHSQSPNNARRVAFHDGPPEEIPGGETGETSNSIPKQGVAFGGAAPGGKSSKWQPLSMVEPSPVAENDPFSLGDSDDEKEKEPPKGKENKAVEKPPTGEVKAEETQDKKGKSEDA